MLPTSPCVRLALALGSSALALGCGSATPLRGTLQPTGSATAAAPTADACGADEGHGVAVGVVTPDQTAPPRQVVQTLPASWGVATEGHGSLEERIAVSAAGHVATIGVDGDVRLWDLETRLLLRVIPSDQASDPRTELRGGETLVWDDQTEEILIVRSDGVVGFDLDGHRHTRSWPRTVRLRAIRGPDQPRWAARRSNDWVLWDDAGRPLATLTGAIGDIDTTPDGTRVIAQLENAIAVFKVDSGERLVTVPMASKPYYNGDMAHSIAISARGTEALVCVQGPDNSTELALVEHLDKKPTTRTLATPRMYGCQVWFADGDKLAVVASASKMIGFDLASGSVVWQHELDPSTTRPASVFAVHDRELVGGFEFSPSGGLPIIDIKSGVQIGELGHRLRRTAFAGFVGTGMVLAPKPDMGGFTHVAVWSLADGAIISSEYADWGDAYHVDDSGRLIAVRGVMMLDSRHLGGMQGVVSIPGAPQPPERFTAAEKRGSCVVYSVGTTADGAPVAKTVARDTWPPTTEQSIVECAPDGKTIGTALLDGRLVLFDPKTQWLSIKAPKLAPVELERVPALPRVTATGEIIAKVIGGGGLWIWDRSGKAHEVAWLASCDGGGQCAERYDTIGSTPDGMQIAVGGNDRVATYAAKDISVIDSWTLPAGSDVTAVAAAASGVIVGTRDGRLMILRHGSKVPVVGGTSDAPIRTIHVTADGSRIVTLSDEGAAVVWGQKGQRLATLLEFEDDESIAVTPGGAYRGTSEAADRVGWVFDAPVEAFRFERFAHVFARPDVVARRLKCGADVADGVARPPSVRAMSVPDRVEANKVTVRATIANLGTGVVRAYVDGKQALVADAHNGDLELEVPLGGGTQTVSLVAFDNAGRASNPKSVRVTSAASRDRPELWIVAAGVGWYPELSDTDQLEAPVNDANALTAELADQVGTKKLYARSHVTVLEDENVTPESLRAALEGLSAMKPQDVGVVFLAGHGVRLANGEAVFLTSTAAKSSSSWAHSGIGWEALATALSRANGRVVVLVDACHAGALTEQLVVPNATLAEQIARSASVLVFAASEGKQVSLEDNEARGLGLDQEQASQIGHAHPQGGRQLGHASPRQRRGNGYFTSAVLASLQATSTDSNHDGLIEASELVEQVTLRVSKASRGAQTPRVVVRNYFGDFTLARAARSQ